MEKLNITSGNWKHREIITHTGSFYRIEGTTESIANVVTRNKERAHDNAELIADAGTTYNSCGMLPSELKAQNEELLEALKKINQMSDSGSYLNALLDCKKIARELIQKIESK